MKINKKMINEVMKDMLNDDERIVDIDIYDEKMISVIVITKHHNIWRYVLDIFNNKIILHSINLLNWKLG